MSNPYLTMYGDTLEHAWGNKAKEKEYNHQYYMRNRARLLARQRKLNGNQPEISDATYQKFEDEHDRITNQMADNKARMDKAVGIAKNFASPGMGYTHEDRDRANRNARNAVNAYNATKRAYDNYVRRARAIDANNAAAQNAYAAEQARIRTGLRSNARAEAAEKIAANNTVGAKIQRGARAAAYKVAGTAERAARRATRAIKNSAVGKKAAEIADRAKKAFEQAKLKFRAAKGAGGDLSGKLRAAYDRAKELYQKAKGKVNQYLNPNFVGPKKR